MAESDFIDPGERPQLAVYLMFHDYRKTSCACLSNFASSRQGFWIVVPFVTVCLALCCVFTYQLGRFNGRRQIQLEAIEHGAARLEPVLEGFFQWNDRSGDPLHGKGKP